MTKQHPLTDKILNQFGSPDDVVLEGQRLFFDTDMRAAYDLGREYQMEECLKWLDKQDEGGLGRYRDLMWKDLRGPKKPIPLFLQIGDAVYFEEWEKVSKLSKKLHKKIRKNKKVKYS